MQLLLAAVVAAAAVVVNGLMNMVEGLVKIL